MVTFLRKSSALSFSFWKDSTSALRARIIKRAAGAGEAERDEVDHELEELDELEPFCECLVMTLPHVAGLRPVTMTVTVSSPLSRRRWLPFLRAAVTFSFSSATLSSSYSSAGAPVLYT